MSSDKIKDVINGIINDSFKVITNVYKYQKESKPENFIVPTGESFIIFPKKAEEYNENDGFDKDDTENVVTARISEQELRFIFVEQFYKSKTEEENGLFYSIETPTGKFYDFKDVPQVVERKDGRSANIDLVIYQKEDDQFNRVALIEFKAHNPDEKDYMTISH